MTPDQTVEEITAEINKKGWLVSSIHQQTMTLWGASVRPKNDFTHGSGVGKTPQQALINAWRKRKEPMSDKQWREFKHSGVTEKERPKRMEKQPRYRPAKDFKPRPVRRGKA